MRVPTYLEDHNAPALSIVPVQRFFGINAAINHKSETQLQGWKDVVTRMYEVYNASALGHLKPYDA